MANRRLALGLLAAAAYAVASHLLMLHAADRPWAIVALLGPLLCVLAGLALRRRDAIGVVLLACVAGGLFVVASRGGVGDVQRLYVAQHAGIHLLLFATFAASLRRGRRSLIGELARRVHGELTPQMRGYTDGVTRMWAGYFAAMAMLSLLVHATCEWSVWSLLANLLTPLVIAALFVGEYLLRYRLHPEFERVRLIDGLGARASAAAGDRR